MFTYEKQLLIIGVLGFIDAVLLTSNLVILINEYIQWCRIENEEFSDELQKELQQGFEEISDRI